MRLTRKLRTAVSKGSLEVETLRYFRASGNGLEENRTLHSLLAKQSRQPWYMRARFSNVFLLGKMGHRGVEPRTFRVRAGYSAN